MSLSEQLQHTFSSDCAVAGCHVPGNPPLGLVLAPGFAYDTSSTSNPGSTAPRLRVNPGDPTTSFLYLKLSENPPPVGYQMPAPATGSVSSASEIDAYADGSCRGRPTTEACMRLFDSRTLVPLVFARDRLRGAGRGGVGACSLMNTFGD